MDIGRSKHRYFIGAGFVAVIFLALGFTVGPWLVPSPGTPALPTFPVLSPASAGAAMQTGWSVPKGTYALNGWAWSPTIGWISMSSKTDGSSVDYGVKLNISAESESNALAGILSGYAWSSNLGWLSFKPQISVPGKPDTTNTDPPPEAPYTPAQILNGQLTGWARFCNGVQDKDSGCVGSSRGDGYDGWVKLSGNAATTDSYGVSLSVDSATPTSAYGGFLGFSSCTDAARAKNGNVNGCAWGSTVVGWIDFSGVSIDIPAGMRAAIDASPALVGGKTTQTVNGMTTQNICVNPTNDPLGCLVLGGNPATLHWNSNVAGAPSDTKRQWTVKGNDLTDPKNATATVSLSGIGGSGTTELPADGIITNHAYSYKVQYSGMTGEVPLVRAESNITFTAARQAAPQGVSSTLPASPSYRER